jgi:hypothetical protein
MKYILLPPGLLDRLVTTTIRLNASAFSTSRTWAMHHARPSKLSAVQGQSQPRPRFTKNTLVMMPTSTPMVPYQPPGQDYAQFISIDSRLMRERIMLLGDCIHEQRANAIICTLLYLKKDDPNKKISLYVNCPGGVIETRICHLRHDFAVSR